MSLTFLIRCTLIIKYNDVSIWQQPAVKGQKFRKFFFACNDQIKATAVPNGFSEEDVDSSESEDQVSKVSRNLRNELTIDNELSSVQTNPNKPARISEVEMAQFIGVLITSGIYWFPDQRFFWMNTTRVESISSNMSRDHFLEIRKYLHVVDNSNQLDLNDQNHDRAHKVRPLLNSVKNNFGKSTVRAKRLPDLIMKDEKDLSKEGRGSIDHRVTEVDGAQLCAVGWYDNKAVNCLCTLYGCQPTDLVERWSPKEKNHVKIARPNIVKAYNQHMGGVDLIDMLISLYRINGRSRKYFTNIIFHLIDLSIVNDWLLYQRHCSQFNTQKRDTISLLSFRISVAEAMLKSASPSSSTKRGRPSLDSTSNEINQTTTSGTVPNSIPPLSVRLDKFDHWPIHTSKGRCRNFGCIGYTKKTSEIGTIKQTSRTVVTLKKLDG
ncbi:unnamed protein product [Rotaria magnacalcarata]